jgi:photosystem II stability/assembly factor-like uncharacterized protein
MSLLTSPSPDYIFQLAAPAAPAQAGAGICFAARTSGLFRSVDGGLTWELAYASLNAREALLTTAVALTPDFEHDPTVFAGLNGAILSSGDGGLHWQPGRLPAPLPAISTLAVSPCYPEDGMAFAGTNEDGVLVTGDRGKNWVSWNFGLLDLNILCLAISPVFAADETLYAGAESGLFRSANGGRAWKEVTLPVDFDAVLSLAISPHFAQDNTLFAGTENNGLFVSQDRGKTWRCAGATTRDAPVNDIFLSPAVPAREIGILHGGALAVSRDGGETWKGWKKKRVGGRNITAVFAPRGPGGQVLAGFEDGNISSL